MGLISEYTRYPFSLLISQSDVEGILQQNLDAQGIHIQRGKVITGVKRIHDAKAEVLFADNSTIVTQYIIAADGAHSTVSKLTDIQDAISG